MVLLVYEGEDHGFTHSYQSVKRFVRKLKARQPERVWRMECEPGEEAQVDFGRIRTLRREDGKLGYSNVLRVTLSFSRKGYTETVPYQNTECFLRGLENAFRHFGKKSLFQLVAAVDGRGGDFFWVWQIWVWCPTTPRMWVWCPSASMALHMVLPSMAKPSSSAAICAFQRCSA